MTEVALLEAVGGELLRGAEPALVSDHRLEVCFARLDNPAPTAPIPELGGWPCCVGPRDRRAVRAARGPARRLTNPGQ